MNRYKLIKNKGLALNLISHSVMAPGLRPISLFQRHEEAVLEGQQEEFENLAASWKSGPSGPRF